MKRKHKKAENGMKVDDPKKKKSANLERIQAQIARNNAAKAKSGKVTRVYEPDTTPAKVYAGSERKTNADYEAEAKERRKRLQAQSKKKMANGGKIVVDLRGDDDKKKKAAADKTAVKKTMVDSSKVNPKKPQDYKESEVDKEVNERSKKLKLKKLYSAS